MSHELTTIPPEFDLLREYITELSNKHVTYHIPTGVIQYKEDVLKQFFQQVDINFHYNPPLDCWEVIEGIVKPKIVSHTVTCYFKQPQYTDVAPGVKRVETR